MFSSYFPFSLAVFWVALGTSGTGGPISKQSEEKADDEDEDDSTKAPSTEIPEVVSGPQGQLPPAASQVEPPALPQGPPAPSTSELLPQSQPAVATTVTNEVLPSSPLPPLPPSPPVPVPFFEKDSVISGCFFVLGAAILTFGITKVGADMKESSAIIVKGMGTTAATLAGGVGNIVTKHGLAAGTTAATLAGGVGEIAMQHGLTESPAVSTATVLAGTTVLLAAAGAAVGGAGAVANIAITAAFNGLTKMFRRGP